jgi:hypothetical protein
MKSHHRAHLWATLKTIDKMLESHETRLANENNAKNILSLINAIRNDISGFLHEFGIVEKQRDEQWSLLVSCSFINNYLVDLEPTRFQQAYGKFNSEGDARRLEHLLATLREKTTELERATRKYHSIL